MSEIRRILIVDDNESIHNDIESILMAPLRRSERDSGMKEMEAELFGPVEQDSDGMPGSEDSDGLSNAPTAVVPNY
ncbi:MAG: hypothetical protein WDZ29_01555 [Balneolaceae bacterium]